MRPPPRFLRRRWHFLVVYWAVQALVAYFLASVLTWLILAGESGDWITWTAPFVLCILILALQAVFLLPLRRPTVAPGGIPVLMSLVIGGLMIGLLFGALGLAVWQAADTYFVPGEYDESIGLSLLAVVSGAWIVSSVLLVAFCRKGRPERVVQRLSAGIFLGTIVEAAAIIPLDALVRRREECICATGTFIGLTICGSVGLLVFGPAILFPLLAGHRKRWRGRRCDACGYDMTGLRGAERCPECGAGWKPRSVS